MLPTDLLHLAQDTTDQYAGHCSLSRERPHLIVTDTSCTEWKTYASRVSLNLSKAIRSPPKKASSTPSTAGGSFVFRSGPHHLSSPLAKQTNYDYNQDHHVSMRTFLQKTTVKNRSDVLKSVSFMAAFTGSDDFAARSSE